MRDVMHFVKGYAPNYATSDKNKPLRMLRPHYLHDPDFKTAQTIFGAHEEGLNYVYSDRLWQWDYDKRKQAGERASELVEDRKTAAWFEAMLSEYHGKEVELVHMESGVNVGNGYPYHVYGFRDS